MSSQKRKKKKNNKKFDNQPIETSTVKEEVIEKSSDIDKPLKTKKLSGFQWVLIGYVAIWITVTVIVCIALYNKCASYQAGYDLAEANANPDNTVSDELYRFDREHILDTVSSEQLGINGYETEDNIDKYLDELYTDSNLSYERNDDYKNSKPSYNILLNDAVFATATFKQLPEPDNYGFHLCELVDTNISPQTDTTETYYIQAFSDDVIFINGSELNVDDEYVNVIEEKALNKAMDNEASERTGIEYSELTYEITGFISAPEITFVRDGEEIQANISSERTEPFLLANLEEEQSGNYYNLCHYYDSDFSSALNDRLFNGFAAGGEAYVLNLNKMGSYERISSFLEPGGPASFSVAVIQKEMRWNGTPENFSLDDNSIVDVVKYNEDTVVVTTHHRISYIYRGDSYDEEMNLQWLYIRTADDKWHIWDFSYI